MPRPKKPKPTCQHCGREFNRQGNLEWHLSTHTNTDETPITGEAELSETCANCHKLEHTIEKQETQLEELSGELTDAAAALRQPQPNPGHQGFQELLDCPNCGPEALKSFEDSGGAVLTPEDFQPKLVELVKQQFPMFSKGVEIST